MTLLTVQLRANALPTRGIPSNPQDQRLCRGGCNRSESLSHVLQGCPVVHFERIRRHNEISHKVAEFCRHKHLEVEEEPHIRHPDGTLFKPDLAIHLGADTTIISDVQVSWETADSLPIAWERKKSIYNNGKFIEAAGRRWPGRSLVFDPIIVGARGIWPRCNRPTEDALGLSNQLKESCVHSALKWGSSIHASFMRYTWRNEGREQGHINNEHHHYHQRRPARQLPPN